MFVRGLTMVLMPLFLVLGCPILDVSGHVVASVHPDHGAPFLEQLSGQWVITGEEGGERRLRFYEDGRFGFLEGSVWTAGSYVILRTDERQKGVLRMEYYVDGNLHLQEVRCEIYFAEHADHKEEEHDHDHDHDGHGHDGEEHAAETHHHEYLKVEVLPAAEQALNMAGDFLHQH